MEWLVLQPTVAKTTKRRNNHQHGRRRTCPIHSGLPVRYDGLMQSAKYKKPLSILGAILVAVLVFLIAKEAKAPEFVAPKAQPGVPAVEPVSIGKVIKDSSGKEYMSNQIIVEFKPEVPEADALAIIANHGAKMDQRFTLVSLFQIHVTDPGDGSVTHKVMAELRALPEVESVNLNYLTTLPAKTN